MPRSMHRNEGFQMQGEEVRSPAEGLKYLEISHDADCRCLSSKYVSAVEICSSANKPHLSLPTLKSKLLIYFPMATTQY